MSRIRRRRPLDGGRAPWKGPDAYQSQMESYEGRVAQPVPFWSVRGLPATYAVVTATETLVNFPIEDFSYQGCSIPSIGTVKISQTGWYQLSAGTGVDDLADATSTRTLVKLTRDGVTNTLLFARTNNSVSGDTLNNVSQLVYLKKGDLLKVYVLHTHGSDRNILTEGYETFFSGFKAV